MTLYINTCFNNLYLKLYSNHKIIREVILDNVKSTNIYLMPGIIDLIDDINLDSIVVVNGPGSFTGVRLGVTVAKTLAYLFNVKIFTITSLEEVAINIDTESYVSIEENNGYFIGRFKDNSLIENYSYLNKQEYRDFKLSTKVIEDVDIDYVKVIEFAISKEPTNPHSVRPEYVKTIEALKWLRFVINRYGVNLLI